VVDGVCVTREAAPRAGSLIVSPDRDGSGGIPERGVVVGVEVGVGGVSIGRSDWSVGNVACHCRIASNGYVLEFGVDVERVIIEGGASRGIA
jgi:hypothetical protein